MSVSAAETCSGRPFSHAPCPRSADLAVDFEPERRTEDRQAVRIVGRAVDRVEYPAERRGGLAVAASLELLAQHDVTGESLGDHRAELPLDLQVDLGDQVDRAFLVDAHVAAEPRQLHVAGTNHRLDRGGQILGRDDLRHRRSEAA